MKKTVLAILMLALVATPCLAQEIEPDGLFSIEGTNWQALPISMRIFPFPWLLPTEFSIAFSGAKVYSSLYYHPGSSGELEHISNSFFVDLGIVSIVRYQISRRPHLTIPGYTEIGFGILQPIGIGMMIIYDKTDRFFFPSIVMVLLIKTYDNWTQLDVE